MSFTTPQQIQQLIENKNRILITFHKNWNGDSVASAVAVWLLLKKMGKTADIVCDDFQLPKQYQFLSGGERIQPAVKHLQKFILTIDVADAGVEELSYDLKDEKLRIFITPKKGFLKREHVRTAQTDFTYDLIIVVDTPDLASLGDLYANNTELFYKIPIINIDHHPANEHFGQINTVDITTASTAEVLFNLFSELGSAYLDEALATTLLTGIIAKTRSFKSANIKPHTLLTASKLMALGADRELIVTNLFRTRSIATLKLWGHALIHMKSDPSIGLISSAITRDDFVRCGATEQDLKEIIDELIVNAPEAKLTLLLHEHLDGNNAIHGMLRTHTPQDDALSLLQPFRPDGERCEASFLVEKQSLMQVETAVIAHIKTIKQ